MAIASAASPRLASPNGSRRVQGPRRVRRLLKRGAILATPMARVQLLLEMRSTVVPGNLSGTHEMRHELCVDVRGAPRARRCGCCCCECAGERATPGRLPRHPGGRRRLLPASAAAPRSGRAQRRGRSATSPPSTSSANSAARHLRCTWSGFKRMAAAAEEVVLGAVGEAARTTRPASSSRRLAWSSPRRPTRATTPSKPSRPRWAAPSASRRLQRSWGGTAARRRRPPPRRRLPRRRRLGRPGRGPLLEMAPPRRRSPR